MSDDRRQQTYRRIGNLAECPACGWEMSPNAYRCPKCFIYFCFKCRTQIREREPQYQCSDQACPQYGKLLCAACTLMVSEFGDVTRTEVDVVPDQPERTVETVETADTLGCAIIAIVVILVFMLSSITIPLWGGIVCSIAAGYATAFIIEKSGIDRRKRSQVLPATTRDVRRDVTENVQVAEHRCCIQCRHPAKVLR